MDTTEEFNNLFNDKEIAELAISLRANLEYFQRELNERIWHTENKLADKDYVKVPAGIRAEVTHIINDMRTLRDHLDADHSGFLSITRV